MRRGAMKAGGEVKGLAPECKAKGQKVKILIGSANEKPGLQSIYQQHSAAHLCSEGDHHC